MWSKNCSGPQTKVNIYYIFEHLHMNFSDMFNFLSETYFPLSQEIPDHFVTLCSTESHFFRCAIFYFCQEIYFFCDFCENYFFCEICFCENYFCEICFCENYFYETCFYEKYFLYFLCEISKNFFHFCYEIYFFCAKMEIGVSDLVLPLIVIWMTPNRSIWTIFFYNWKKMEIQTLTQTQIYNYGGMVILISDDKQEIYRYSYHLYQILVMMEMVILMEWMHTFSDLTYLVQTYLMFQVQAMLIDIFFYLNKILLM